MHKAAARRPPRRRGRRPAWPPLASAALVISRALCGAGVYFLNKTLALTAADSGQAISAAPGDEV